MNFVNMANARFVSSFNCSAKLLGKVRFFSTGSICRRMCEADINDNVAKDIFKFIQADCSSSDLIVDFGFSKNQVSLNFLEKTNNKLLLFHGEQSSLPASYKEQYSDRFSQCFMPQSKFPQYSLINNGESLTDKIDESYKGCIGLKIFLQCLNAKSLEGLSVCYVNRLSFFRNYKPTLYILLPLEIGKCLGKKVPSKLLHYQKVARLFNVYFNSEMLSQYFITGNDGDSKHKNVAFVKVSINDKTAEKFSEGELAEFHFFINILLRSERYSCLVSKTNELFPRTSIPLLEAGFKMFESVDQCDFWKCFKAFKVARNYGNVNENFFGLLKSKYGVDPKHNEPKHCPEVFLRT